MKTVWHSLIWKEWHEHKWKLAALTIILFSLPIITLLKEPKGLLLVALSSLTAYGVIAGAFLGMSVASGERSRKTLPLLQSQPLAMWRPAIIRLALAGLTVGVPILLLNGALYVLLHSGWSNGIDVERDVLELMPFLFRQSWGIENWFASITTGSLLGAWSLLLWMAAIGVNRSNEIRAGAIGFLSTMLVWWSIAVVAENINRVEFPGVDYTLRLLMAAAPAGPGFVGTAIETGGNIVPFAIAAIASHSCALIWFLTRYGRTQTKSMRSAVDGVALAPVPQVLLPPRRSQLSAIAWKQFCETGPLAGAAVGAVLGIFAVHIGFGRSAHTQAGEALMGITMMVGFFFTLVAGIGVYFEDLKPGVNTFWRSRPLDLRTWFVVKFAIGWLLLATVFGVLLLIAMMIDASWWSHDLQELSVQIAFGVLAFTMIYTLAMATYCLFRQPLYAAVATLGLFFGSIAMLGWIFDSQPPNWVLLLAMATGTQLAVIAIAWMTVKKGWGWGG